jgi:hypothetical protein
MMIWLSKLLFNKGNCPICKGPIHYKAFVIIAPWVRELIKTKKKISQIGICESCHGAAFNLRYNDKQMRKIYETYRDDSYNELRFKWEKWYGKEYQHGHLTKRYIEGRKKELAEFLTKYLPDKINRIVDIGGGNGELIPESINGDPSAIKKYVLDISNVDSLPCVTKINSLNEIDTVDLVIYSHIIEHVANPFSELENILKHTKHIYIETPYGIPKISYLNKSLFLNVLFVLLSLNPTLWRNMFSLSVGLKSKKRILRQSEHINFFEVATIERLANLLDCDSIIRLSSVNNPLRQKHQVIQALFSKR